MYEQRDTPVPRKHFAVQPETHIDWGAIALKVWRKEM